MRLNVIPLLTIVASIIVLLELKHNWLTFWDDQVTLKDKELTSKLAFFVLVPIGVLCHEIGHSLATWQVGGTVETFRWFGFSGYIIPSGDFSLGERWWIFFAGNLVSILLGLIAIPLAFQVQKRIVAETLYAFAFIQLIYALIGYPLYSLLARLGDWVFIYNPLFQPYIYLLLAAHLILVYQLWQLHHSKKVMAWRLSRNSQILTNYQELQAEQIKRPQDLQPQLDLAYFLISNQEDYAAKKLIRQIQRSDPHSPKLKVLNLVMNFYSAKFSQVIKQGKKLLSENLPLEDLLRLYRIICLSYLNTHDYQNTVASADQGLAIAPKDATIRSYRASGYEKLGNYSAAIADLNIAINNCQDQELKAWMIETREQCQRQLK